MKWEYMIEENVYGHMAIERLNLQGEEGWELCAVLGVGSSVQLVYKRLKPQHP
ncbi:MAG: hypothetical protein ABI811_09935 [Acidobacteriota bacterium]